VQGMPKKVGLIYFFFELAEGHRSERSKENSLRKKAQSK